MSETLLACPGCGGVAREGEREGYPRRPVECTQCGFAADDAETWNRRTPGPATTKTAREVSAMINDDADPADNEYVFVPLAGCEARAFVAECRPAKEVPPCT